MNLARLGITILIALAVSAASSSAAADPADTEAPPPPQPPSGVGPLVAGGVLTGMGPLLMLSSIPICAIYVPDNQLLVLAVSGGKTGRGDGPENVCWGALLGTGAAMLLVGLPVLMLGANQRSKYKVWLQDTPGVRYRVKYGEGITLLPIHGGIALGWHTEF